MSEQAAHALDSAGEFTSKLANSYIHHFHTGNETDKGNPSRLAVLTAAWKSVDLPVSSNQVIQLLDVSRELKGCGQPDGGRGQVEEVLSWGEFCVCSVELFELKSRQESPQTSGTKNSTVKSPPPSSRSSATFAPPRYHTSQPVAEVFLGGSCNPTTWRKDSAIPALQQVGVTYYNPQVEEWHPELIEIEERAKDSASLLFFVIDSQTRAVSSMVEIAYFAGIGRDLIVVVDDISTENPKIGEDTLSKRETEDLNRGRAFVRSLLETGGSVLASDIQEGIKASAEILKQNLAVCEYTALSPYVMVPHSHSLGEGLTLLRQVFVMYDTNRKGILSLQEAELAFRAVHIHAPALYNQLGCKKIFQTIRSNELISKYEAQGMTFDDFCMVYAELRYNQILQSTRSGPLLSSLAYFTLPLQWMVDWLWPSSPPHPPMIEFPYCDIFLGGSCGHTTWRADIAIPLFRQHGISYFNPQLPHWDVRMIPIEREAKEHSSVLLFVVTGDTLSVASMVEVAYYIGAGRRMVVCLTDIPADEGSEIEGMKLSACSIKDYNRGRAYLASVANKSRVPVYTNISDAVHRAVHLVRGHYLNHTNSVPLGGTSV